MTNWTPQHLSPRGAVYIAIADALAGDVNGGRLQPGERLPTHRELARRLGVNVVTVTRAYTEAARRGLVEGEVGRGTFVTRVEPRSTVQLPLQPEPSDRIDFHFNLPTGPERLDLEELYTGLRNDGLDPLAATYLPVGQADHRAAGAAWMARSGVEEDAERVVLTSGAQHAMTVAFSTLTDPGDTVLTEELTYPGMKALASVLHLRTVPVALDEQGLRPDALERACRKSNPKALYCMPTLQNPTGLVWTEERRREVVEIARRYGVVLIEDDTTGFLVENPPVPLAALAPELTVFIASLSKSLGPGLRTGFLLLPEVDRCVPGPLRCLRDRLAANLAAITWMTPPLMAEISARLIQSGKAARIVAGKRREVKQRRQIFDRVFTSATSQSHPTSSFLWLPLPDPWRCQDFVAEARQGGVGTTSAEAFIVGRAHAPHAVRLCIGTPRDRADVEQGLGVLAEMMARAAARCWRVPGTVRQLPAGPVNADGREATVGLDP